MTARSQKLSPSQPIFFDTFKIFLLSSVLYARLIFCFNIPVSDGMADVVDVVYVNIVTWSLGCVRVGEVAKGEQLIANQGQEWMGICATIKKAGSPS